MGSKNKAKSPAKQTTAASKDVAASSTASAEPATSKQSVFSNLRATVVVTLIALSIQWLVKNYYQASEPAAANKPYTTMEEFFPFYLTEHSNLICRRLHFVGTSLVLLVAVNYPSLLANACAAASLGMALMPLFMHMQTGIIEGVACLLSFVLLSRRTTGALPCRRRVLRMCMQCGCAGRLYARPPVMRQRVGWCSVSRRALRCRSHAEWQPRVARDPPSSAFCCGSAHPHACLWCDRRLVVPAAGCAGVWVRLRMGRPLLLRAQQARVVRVPDVSPCSGSQCGTACTMLCVGRPCDTRVALCCAAPLWLRFSLMSDFVMWSKFVMGTIQR